MDEQAKRSSRPYDDVTREVKRLVDRYDPEGLLALGAPEDEYDDAIADLARRILKGEPIDRQSIELWFGSAYGSPHARAEALAESLEVFRYAVKMQQNDPALGSLRD